MHSFIYQLLKRLLIIGMLLPVFVNADSAGQFITLSFFDSATVNDTAIHLADIAVISSGSDSLVRLFSGVNVGDAAPPGYSRFVSTNDLLVYRLTPAFKGLDLKYDRNKRIKVRTGCIEKQVHDYTDAIQEYVLSHSAWKEGRVSVAVETPHLSWKCFDAPLNVTIQGPADLYPKGRLQLHLVAEQYGKAARIPVSCRVTVVVPVLVTKGAIPRNKIFGTDDIEKREIDITDFGPTPCFEANEVLGRRALRSLSAGTILHNRLFVEMPVVTKGDVVSIVKTSGDVKISVAAIARENGYSGQKIWVENSMTHKLIHVTVKDKSSCSLM